MSSDYILFIFLPLCFDQGLFFSTKGNLGVIEASCFIKKMEVNANRYNNNNACKLLNECLFKDDVNWQLQHILFV